MLCGFVCLKLFALSVVMAVDSDYSYIKRIEQAFLAASNTFEDALKLNTQPISELVTFWCSTM